MTLPNPLPAAESYNLDLMGNRRTSAGVSQSANGTQNQLQTDGTFNYLYDGEGNITRRTTIATGAVVEYTWDFRNRMTSVTNKTSATGTVTKRVEFVYDAFDRRVAKRIDNDGNGTWDRYDAWLWDGQEEIEQIRDSDGQGTGQGFRISNRYLFGGNVDELLSDEQYTGNTGFALGSTTPSTTAGNTLWALTDHLGSVRDVVDNNGVIRQHVVYDGFGRRLREVDYNAAGAVIAGTDPAAIDVLFGYTGRDWDADVALQYNRARWYDPATGRWTSRDPIGFAAGDGNLYRYVGNGATGATDPSGLEDLLKVPQRFSPERIQTDYYHDPYVPTGQGEDFRWVANPNFFGEAPQFDVWFFGKVEALRRQRAIESKGGNLRALTEEDIRRSEYRDWLRRIHYAKVMNLLAQEATIGMLGSLPGGVISPRSAPPPPPRMRQCVATGPLVPNRPAPKVPISPKSGLPIPTPATSPVPQPVLTSAQTAIGHINSGTNPPWPGKWGVIHKNSEVNLPKLDAVGNPITYSEYYLPKSPGDTTKWGANRLVVGSDGNAYCTTTHYGQSGNPPFVYIGTTK